MPREYQPTDEVWSKDRREVRSVVFTLQQDGTLEARAHHFLKFVSPGKKPSWEAGPVVTATQDELLAAHPQAAEVLAALTELFHAKADQAQA